MKKFTVKSLPLRDVIQDLANEMETSCKEKCSEYIVTVPKKSAIKIRFFKCVML